MLISTKNGKTGIVRAIALAICVVMLVAFAAGCSDEHAQSLANAAQTAADQAAEAAKQAQEAAKQAQGTADQAIKDAASANSNANSKFTETQVKDAILEILKDYVKAEDAATKAELENVSKQLANYLTEDAVKALISAAAASKEDLDKAKQDILAEVDKAIKGLDAFYTKLEVEEMFKKYYTSDKIDEALKAFDDYYKKGEVDKFVKDINDKFENYIPRDELIKELSFLSNELNALRNNLTSLQSKLLETADKTLADAKAYADQIAARLDAFDNLTDDVAAKYLELLAHQDKYIEENGHLYDADGLKAVYNKYSYATILLIRATTEDAMNAVINDVEKSIDGIDTILDQLYDALVAVEATKIEGVNGEMYVSIAAGESTMDSGEAIDACLALLDKALANGITVEELNAYPDMALETATKAYDAEYTRLENAKFAADKTVFEQAATYEEGRVYYSLANGVYTPVAADQVNKDEITSYYVVAKTAVNDLVNALENWAEYKADGGNDTTKTPAALGAKLNAAQVAYYAWMDEYFEAYEDEANPNIANLVPGWSTIYKLASEHWLALTGLGELVEDYLAKINALLGDEKTGWDTNNTVLYTYLEEITNLVKAIDADEAKYGFLKVVGTLNERYEDLGEAKVYANAANELYLAFVAETDGKSVYTQLVEFATADRIIKNYGMYENCIKVVSAWMMDETTKRPKFGADEDNVTAIVNSNEATSTLYSDVSAASKRFVELKAAEAEAETINSEIAKFYNGEEIVVGYDEMDKLDAILDSIAEWLEEYNIAAPDAEGNYAEGHYADNYNMVDHAELAAVIAECQAKIDDVLACEHLAKFKNVITNIISEDGMNWSADAKQLYFYEEYIEARDAYTAWTDKWDIVDPSLEKFNGGTNQDDVNRVAEMFKDLNTVGTAIDNELKLATKEYTETYAKAYADFKAEMAKFADGKYVPAITGSEWVVAAYEAASKWATAHTDASGFTAEIDAFGLLTGEEYNNIVKVYDEYIKLVGEATGKLNAIADKLAPYFTLTEGVYTFKISLITDVTTLETIEGEYTGTAGWLAAYAVADEDAITDAALKALAHKFDADLTAVMTELRALLASFEADLKALNFGMKLDVFESDVDGKVINIYSNYFGDLKALRDSYNAFADKYFLGNNSSEAFANSMQFTALNIYVKRLEALEAKVRLLEDAKKKDGQTIIDAINAIIADGVTTDDKTALEAARKALDAWMKDINMDYEKKFVKGIFYTVDVRAAANKLADAEETFKNLIDLLKTAKDAIADLGEADSPAVNYTDDKALDGYKALYDAAKKAYDDFVKANGSAGTETLTDDLKITADEKAILENGKNEISAYAILCAAQKVYDEAYAEYVANIADPTAKENLEQAFKLELNITIANIKRLVAADEMTTAEGKPTLLANELKIIATNSGSSSEAPETDDTGDDTYPEGTNP